MKQVTINLLWCVAAINADADRMHCESNSSRTGTASAQAFAAVEAALLRLRSLRLASEYAPVNPAATAQPVTQGGYNQYRGCESGWKEAAFNHMTFSADASAAL